MSGLAINSWIPDSTTCSEPGCIPALSALNLAGTLGSDGFVLTAGGAINTDGQAITDREPDTYARNTSTTRVYENYTYFARQYSLGLNPAHGFPSSSADAQKPPYDEDKDYYFHAGDMTIQSPWAVAAGESYTIFVNGKLTITDPLSEGELIQVAQDGFLAFIVSGDIEIDRSVGHSDRSQVSGNVEGIYIADGTITIESNGGYDKKFVGEGTFVGWTDVVLERDFSSGGDGNDSIPTETFIYRPDFVKNTPEIMKRSQMIWQETN